MIEHDENYNYTSETSPEFKEEYSNRSGEISPKSNVSEYSKDIYEKIREISLKSYTKKTDIVAHINNDIIIDVGFPVESDKNRQTFASYKVKTKVCGNIDGFECGEYEVDRRYTEFRSLYGHIEEECPASIMPSFPEKQLAVYTNQLDPKFLSKRRSELERFLKHIVNNKTFIKIDAVKFFLTSEHEMPKCHSMASRLDTIMDLVQTQLWPSGYTDPICKKMGDDLIPIHEHGLIIMKHGNRLMNHLNQLGSDMAHGSINYRNIGGGGNVYEIFKKIVIGLQMEANQIERFQVKMEHDALGIIRFLLEMTRKASSGIQTLDAFHNDLTNLEIYHEDLIDQVKNIEISGIGGLSIGDYFKRKYESFKGMDEEQSKQLRLKKLDQKIIKTNDAIQRARTSCKGMDKIGKEEHSNFMKTKQDNLLESVVNIFHAFDEYHSRMYSMWKFIIDVLDDDN